MGVAEESDGNARLKVPHLNLRLDRGIPLNAGNRDQIHIVERQLGQLGNSGLNKDCRLRGVNAAREIVERHLHNVAPHLFGVLGIVGQRLRVRNHDEDFVEFARVLKFYTLLERPDVMPDMESSCRSVPCKNHLFHFIFYPFSFSCCSCCLRFLLSYPT